MSFSFLLETKKDEITGYSFSFILENNLDKIYGLSSLSDVLKSQKPKVITNDMIDLFITIDTKPSLKYEKSQIFTFA